MVFLPYPSVGGGDHGVGLCFQPGHLGGLSYSQVCHCTVGHLQLKLELLLRASAS